MINLLPQCTKCGSFVTDSIESEIEQHGKIKTGNYTNGVWICNNCLGASRIQEEKKKTEKKEEEYSSLHTSQDDNRNNLLFIFTNRHDMLKIEISPNQVRGTLYLCILKTESMS